MDLERHLLDAVAAIRSWQDRWGTFPAASVLDRSDEAIGAALKTYTDRLTTGNFPFFHPRYAGQMLKPPHPVAITGYLAAMLINTNNHALDGGPPTSEMEKEVIKDLASLFGFTESPLGHLTSSGTIANLEALWVGREISPGKKIAHSAEAHYTHARMAQVLGVPSVAVATDGRGHLDLDDLHRVLAVGDIGTLVLTAGTTGLGAVDPIDEAIPIAQKFGVRVHVDAAYGGFFMIPARSDADVLRPEVRRRLKAVEDADSVVVDPHKHGLQPYGCGCVLFRDAGVGRFYRHDSPYTYFTSDDLHLGEISLECSRAGASAGALWLTLQVFPLRMENGLGNVVVGGVSAANAWYSLLQNSDLLAPVARPDLDILAYYARKVGAASEVSRVSRTVMHALVDDEDPVFLGLLQIQSDVLEGVSADIPQSSVLRSVLMKPEHEAYVGTLHSRIEEAVRGATA